MVQDDTQIWTQLKSRIDTQDAKIDGLISQLSTLTSAVDSMIETLTTLPNSFEQLLKSFRISGEEVHTIPIEIEDEEDNTSSLTFKGEDESDSVPFNFKGEEEKNATNVEVSQPLINERNDSKPATIANFELNPNPKIIINLELKNSNSATNVESEKEELMHLQINLGKTEKWEFPTQLINKIGFGSIQSSKYVVLNDFSYLKPPKPPPDYVNPNNPLSYSKPDYTNLNHLHLINSYSKCWCSRCARHVFDESPEPKLGGWLVKLSHNINQHSTEVHFAATMAVYNALKFAPTNFQNKRDTNYIIKVVCEITMTDVAKIVIRHAEFEFFVIIFSTYYEVHGPCIQTLFELATISIKGDEVGVAVEAIKIWSSICDEEVKFQDYGNGEGSDSYPFSHYIKKTRLLEIPSKHNQEEVDSKSVIERGKLYQILSTLWDAYTIQFLKVFKFGGLVESLRTIHGLLAKDEATMKFAADPNKEKPQNSYSFFWHSHNTTMRAIDVILRVAAKRTYSNDNRIIGELIIKIDETNWIGPTNGLVVTRNANGNLLLEFQHHSYAICCLCTYGFWLWVRYASGTILVKSSHCYFLGEWVAHVSLINETALTVFSDSKPQIFKCRIKNKMAQKEAKLFYGVFDFSTPNLNVHILGLRTSLFFMTSVLIENELA